MQVCLDRFAVGMADTVGQELKEYTICEGCGESIYIGDDMLELQDGALVHDDLDCLRKYTGAVMREAG